MRRRFHWRPTVSNLDYLRGFAESQGASVNGSLNGIVRLLREHGVRSIEELTRLVMAKKNVVPLS